MTNFEPPIAAGGPPVPVPMQGTIVAVTGLVAVLGGLLAMAVAVLVTTSVLARWLFNAPIDGDFEYVKMATAVAVFAYLPFTQARRGNIFVDTFTGWMPPRARNVVDAAWDLIYAAFMGFCTYAMTVGTYGAFTSGETTMQRQLPLWPSIALATALCGLLAVTAVVTAVRLLGARNGGGAP